MVPVIAHNTVGFFTFLKYGMHSQVIKDFFNPPKDPRGSGVPLAPIPPKLKLRDGREFDVGDLFRACSKPENIRLNSELSRRMSGYQRVAKKSVTRQRAPVPNRKYTYEERVWISDAVIDDIMTRYGMDKQFATRLKAQSRYICKDPEFHANRGN